MDVEHFHKAYNASFRATQDAAFWADAAGSRMSEGMNDRKDKEKLHQQMNGVLIRAGVAVVAKRLLQDPSITKEEALEALQYEMLGALDLNCASISWLGYHYYESDGKISVDDAINSEWYGPSAALSDKMEEWQKMTRDGYRKLHPEGESQ